MYIGLIWIGVFTKSGWFKDESLEDDSLGDDTPES